jgi:hypothetical protein
MVTSYVVWRLINLLNRLVKIITYGVLSIIQLQPIGLLMNDGACHALTQTIDPDRWVDLQMVMKIIGSLNLMR